MPLQSDLNWISLPGLSRYQEVHELQRRLLEQRIRNEVLDTVILCEHFPTLTRGRGLQFQADQKERSKPLTQVPLGTDYVEVERGGDLTWHGPGQLVSYPIVKLSGAGRLGKKIGPDVDRWIRFQEKVWIRVLSSFGVTAHSLSGKSGVWVGNQKWVSVGIALQRWVSYHGTAANIINDPQAFFGFEPCGFRSEIMIRAADLGIPELWVQPQSWRLQWERLYQKSFEAELS